MSDSEIRNHSRIGISLYILAAIIVLIPSLVTLISNRGFSSDFSKVVISVAFICIEVGLLIRTHEKRKREEPIVKNITTIIGILLAMIWGILK